jgi:hypothetical protein
MLMLNRCRTSWEHAIASCDTVGAWRHCATEKAMRDGHSWILAVSADGCLQAFEITRSDLPKPKNRIWIGGSLTHLTHITHRIFGVSYASCSWSPMRRPAPDHDHESARAAYLRGPLPGSCLACRFWNCGWSLRSRRSAAPDRPVQDGSAGAHQRGCHMLIRHDCRGLSYQAHPDLDQNLLYCLIWIR